MKQLAGYTLIELMTAIAVIAILSAIAVPGVFSWAATQRFSSGVRDVRAAIEAMRLVAVKENARAIITFVDDGTSPYQTEWVRDIVTYGPFPHTLPNGVTVLSTFTDGKLRFNSQGTVDEDSGGTEGNITINGTGGKCLRISVIFTGKASIEECN